MEKKKYIYLPYSKKIGDVLLDYAEGDCIVCQNEQFRSILEAQLYTRSLFEKRPTILSLEGFLSSICLSEKLVLKDLHRIFALYQALSEEQKQTWKIKTYFDFVDIANEFFHFYEEIMGLEAKLEEEILPWQREKFLFFQELKASFDQKLEEEQSIPKDWLYKKEYYDSYYAKQFSRIVFLDIVSFPSSFLEILSLLEEDCKIEFVLQLAKEDFQEEKLALKQCSLEMFSGNVSCYQIGSDWEESLFLLAEKEKAAMGVYSTRAKEKQFYKMFPSSFSNPQKNRFNESALYGFLEAQLDCLHQKEQEWKQELGLEKCLETIQKRSIRDYYGFWEADAVLLRKLLAEEYRYISLDLLQNPNYQEILDEAPEFYQKMTSFLKDLWAIEDCQNLSDLYQYFEKQLKIEKMKEEAYPDVLDLFYEILSRLSSYEKNENFGSFQHYFEGNTGKQLYQLLFRSLHRIYLKAAEEYIPGKVEIQDWHFLPYEKEKEEQRRTIILDVDDKSLPNIQENLSFLTEQQRLRLGLKTREEEVLEEKYRFYQALSSQKELVFLVQKSEKDNKSSSSFLEEWLWKQGKKIEKSPYSKEFFLASLAKSFEALFPWEREEEVGAYLEKDNKELLKEGKLVLGAYDWQSLQSCEKRFYFSKVLPDIEGEDLPFGWSPRIFGSICHRFMEKIGKLEWKEFLNTGRFSIEEKKLYRYLREEFQKEELRLPKFLNHYLEGIVFPRIVKNTLFFLSSIEKKYQGQKVIRFQGEKGLTREGVYRGEDLQVSFHGRADLVVETELEREIIDYKTGKTSEDQLDFYAFLLYGEEEKVGGRYYNLWDGNFTEGKRKEIYTEQSFIDFFKHLEEKEYYQISKKKASCATCPYVNICRREEEV